MHKINGPTLVHRSRCGQRNRITQGPSLFSFATKIQFQQAVNPVYTLMIPGVSLHTDPLPGAERGAQRRAVFCLVGLITGGVLGAI